MSAAGRRVVAISTNPALDRVLVAPGARSGGVVRATLVLESAGGKAAQAARVASALGADVTLVAALGGDRGGHYRELLDAAGVASRIVAVAGETRQTISVVDDGDLLEIHEPSSGLSADEADALVAAAESELDGAEVATVSGSLPPGAPGGLHARLVRAARERGAFTLLDTSSPDAFALAVREHPDIIAPNLDEARLLDGGSSIAPDDLTGATELARRLAERLGTAVWLTLGALGSLIVSDGRCVRLSLAPRGPVRNAVGAGDALVGGLAAGLCRGLSLLEAARLGVAAASNAVTHEASATIDRAIVDEARTQVLVQLIAEERG